MPLFKYFAIEGNGKRFSGVLNADSFDVAKEILRKQKVMVVKLVIFREKKKDVKLPRPILISFTRDLSQLLRAGLPLYESLLTIEEKYRGMRFHAIFLSLCDKVKHGLQLSKALAEYGDCFDPIYVSMVSAGEETGSLDEVFTELEGLLSRSAKLKKQLTSALIYPAFLASFCAVVVAALFFFLIPSMKQLFEGRELHPLTTAILKISEWLNANGVFLLIGILLFLFGSIVFFKHPRGKRAFYHFLLVAPLLKRVTTSSVLVRFCRALSVLLTSSVAMVDALRYARRIMHNPYFESVIENAEKRIMQGGKLSEELARSPLIPKMVIRMLSIGEEAGNTSSMLKSVADIYEEDLDKSLTRLTSMIQPAMLMILAFIVGVVILSVLLPLTDVSSFIN
jgi:general secretion pathway protein F